MDGLLLTESMAEFIFLLLDHADTVVIYHHPYLHDLIINSMLMTDKRYSIGIHSTVGDDDEKREIKIKRMRERFDF